MHAGSSFTFKFLFADLSRLPLFCIHTSPHVCVCVYVRTRRELHLHTLVHIDTCVYFFDKWPLDTVRARRTRSSLFVAQFSAIDISNGVPVSSNSIPPVSVSLSGTFRKRTERDEETHLDWKRFVIRCYFSKTHQHKDECEKPSVCKKRVVTLSRVTRVSLFRVARVKNLVRICGKIVESRRKNQSRSSEHGYEREWKYQSVPCRFDRDDDNADTRSRRIEVNSNDVNQCHWYPSLGDITITSFHLLSRRYSTILEISIQPVVVYVMSESYPFFLLHLFSLSSGGGVGWQR